MSVLWLALVVAWTYVFIRIVGLRVTLSTRTLLGFLAAGMIFGPLAIAVTGIFVNPYGWRGQDQAGTQVTVNVLSFILAHAIVAAPILYMIAIRGRYRAISVADAFTCGFLFGFGADLVSVALTVAQSSDIPTGFSIVPPFVVSSAGVTLAGYAYWTGLTAMLFVAVARFSRQLPLAYLAAAAAVLWWAFEHAMLVSQSDMATRFSALVFHGAERPAQTHACVRRSCTNCAHSLT